MSGTGWTSHQRHLACVTGVLLVTFFAYTHIQSVMCVKLRVHVQMACSMCAYYYEGSNKCRCRDTGIEMPSQRMNQHHIQRCTT